MYSHKIHTRYTFGTKKEIWWSNLTTHLMIFAKQFDFGQKIRCCAKEVGNFSISKRPKIGAFLNFQKKKLRTMFCTKNTPLIFFGIISNSARFRAIFRNLRKRLESAILRGSRKCITKRFTYVELYCYLQTPLLNIAYF